MKQRRSILIVLAVVLAAGAAWGAAAPVRTTVGGLDILSGPVEGTLGGTLQFTRGVTVTSQGMKLTCDTLKVWPSQDGRTVDRVDAMGNVRLTGTYTANDGTKWQVNGRAKNTTLNNRTQVGTLSGDVDLRAVNLANRSSVSAKCDTFTYNQKTGAWKMDRAGQQVQIHWEPAPASEGQ